MSANDLGHIASELLSKAKLCYGGRGCIDALSTVIVMFCFHVFVDIKKCIFYESEKKPYYCNVPA